MTGEARASTSGLRTRPAWWPRFGRGPPRMSSPPRMSRPGRSFHARPEWAAPVDWVAQGRPRPARVGPHSPAPRPPRRPANGATRPYGINCYNNRTHIGKGRPVSDTLSRRPRPAGTPPFSVLTRARTRIPTSGGG